MCALQFSGINYTVTTLKEKRKQILHEINGYFPGGRLIAIMGPSGAGKSSLLNILTGFISNDDGISGSIQINGTNRNNKHFRKISCYITQEDSLCDYLTVEENMLYAADFKMAPIEEKETKIYAINEVLDSLGLLEQRNTLTRRLSGGERKRLSIAQELLSDPMYLFLDEPTTGLDCISSFQCVNELKSLTRQGKTVICTIHQPSDGMFKLFDHVYMLAEGKCTYHGSVENLVTYFNDLGMPCNIYSNPADYAIELSSGDYGLDKVNKMLEAIDNGRNHKYLIEHDILKKPKMKLKTQLPPLIELWFLVKWQWFKLHRKKNFTHLIIFGTISINMLIGILNFNCANDASKMLNNYYMIISFIMANAQPALMITLLFFPKESSILKKELFNGYYRLKTYLIAITLTDFPLTIIITLLGSSTIYIMTGQIFELKRYAMFMFGQLFIFLISLSLGTLISSSFSFLNSMFVGSVLLIPLMLLSGFGFMLKDLPQTVIYASHFAYFKYCLSMLSVALYGMERPKWNCPDDKYCIYMRGDKFFSMLGVDLHHYWTDALFLFSLYSFIKIATYFVMKNRIKM